MEKEKMKNDRNEILVRKNCMCESHIYKITPKDRQKKLI